MAPRKTLWLCSWYPNKLEPFNGDFIQRHAQAVAGFCELRVIYVVRDKQGTITRDVKTETMTTGGVKEEIIYYYVKPSLVKSLDQYYSYKKYKRLFRKAVEDYIKENGCPDIVHVHVGMKAGRVALWMKKKFNIQYVITEHWSGFLENAKEKFTDLPGYIKSSWRKVIEHASGISAVSDVLAKGLKVFFPQISPVVIPNVVNTEIFYLDDKVPEAIPSPVFVHISGMQELKNPLQILQAFKIVLNSCPGATLKMIGCQDNEIPRLAKKSGLDKSVFFFNEMPQRDLAKHISASTALILYSSYETFGCVIIEANACGVPVIVSDIPVFQEIVSEDENGFFTKLNDVNGLAAVMIQVAEERASFNRQKIAKMAESKYSYPVIGKMFFDWYQKILE